MLAEIFMIRLEVTARTVAGPTPAGRFVPFNKITFGEFREQRIKAAPAHC